MFPALRVSQNKEQDQRQRKAEHGERKLVFISVECGSGRENRLRPQCQPGLTLECGEIYAWLALGLDRRRGTEALSGLSLLKST